MASGYMVIFVTNIKCESERKIQLIFFKFYVMLKDWI